MTSFRAHLFPVRRSHFSRQKPPLRVVVKPNPPGRGAAQQSHYLNLDPSRPTHSDGSPATLSGCAILFQPPSRKLTPCAAPSIPQDVSLLRPSLSGLVPVRPAAPPVARCVPPLLKSRVRPLFTRLRRGTGSLRTAILVVHPLGRLRFTNHIP